MSEQSDDDNVNFESEDDDESMQSNQSNMRNGRSNDFKGDNKRYHHNALERRRRDVMKDSFCKLKDAVPSLQGEKASRAQILKKAAEYIQVMKKKNTIHQTDIEELKKLNKTLEEQIES